MDPARLSHIPGYRDLLADVSEANGSLVRLQEIVDDHGIVRLIEALNLGLVIYTADYELLVPLTAFRLYSEMLDRADDDEMAGRPADIDEIEEAPQVAAE